MTEQKVKNRAWVKTAAIIFLSILLVLTFFSNTIMNRSLPEVAVQTAQSGTISTQLRGNGTITPVETYEVRCEDSRKVQSVLASVGQQVKTGDLLFVLATGDSEELKALQDTLQQKVDAYQRQLISLGQSSGGESKEVSRAREALQKAIEERDRNAAVSAEDVARAKEDLDYAKLVYEEAARKLEEAGGETTTDSAALEAAQDALSAAQTAYDAKKLRYVNEYSLIMALADAASRKSRSDSAACAEAIAAVFADTGAESPTLVDYYNDTSAEAMAERGNLYIEDVDIGSYPYKDYLTKLPSKTLTDLAHGYNEVAAAEKALSDAQDALDKLEDAPDNSRLSRKAKEAKADYDRAQSEYDDLKNRYDSYEASVQRVESCQDALEDALTNSRLTNHDLSIQAREIAEIRQQIADLTGEGEGTGGGEIRATVNGVITAVNITSGNNTDPATPMCTIEIPDRGYTVSMSVTPEQAQKLTLGDTAELATGYWGASKLTGKLVAIRNDPKNPQGSRVLLFEVQGDTQSGQQVSITIGQRSQTYEVVIPKSAVRSDSNGKFVYIVQSKPSPLGNRYSAVRVDVQVAAEDDKNCAVTGGVAQWDYVITTASAPIDNGMLVRLPEN